MLAFKSFILFMALLSSLFFLHDIVGNIFFMAKDDYKSIKKVYPWITAFFWAFFYFLVG